MAWSRTLRTHPQPLDVIVAAVWDHLLPAGLLGDLASDGLLGPEPTTQSRTGDGSGQLLLLIGTRQGRLSRRNGFQAVIAQALGTISLVAVGHAAVARAVAGQCRGVRGRLPIADERQELPPAHFNPGRCPACPLAQLGVPEMGVEVGSTCHGAAFQLPRTHRSFRVCYRRTRISCRRKASKRRVFCASFRSVVKKLLKEILKDFPRLQDRVVSHP